jgi:hypothetical protein
MQRSAAAFLVGALAAVLVGCSVAAPFGIPEFANEQSTNDRLPDDVDSSSLDPSTSRLLDEADGVQYFAVRSSDEVCLVVFAAADEWAVGCSSELPLDVEAQGHPTARLESTTVESDTWEPIGKHISIEKDK